MADPDSIYGLFARCFDSFGTLVIALSKDGCRVVHLEQVRPAQLFEEYGRLKIWGVQARADMPSQARGSLDDTLRRDDELRDLVQGILQRLDAVLGRGKPANSQHVPSLKIIICSNIYRI